MEQVLQHFRKEEQPFIEQVYGWQRDVVMQYAPKLTNFLDPRERFIVRAIIGQQEDIKIATSGGFIEAERERMLIYPSYYVPTEEDFLISLYRITYPTKFMTLTHPDVLGALLSHGVARSRFGDIRLQNDIVQFAIEQELATFIEVQLTAISNSKVRINSIALDEALLAEEGVWVTTTYIVSSLRLDAVLASAFNLSREKAQKLIGAGHVKVNFAVREDRALELQEEDLLSIRSYGRLKVTAIEGRTKKDKIKLILGKMER